MTQPRVEAYVGLGANLGDASSTLAAAIHALAAMPDVRLHAVSRLYATAPVGVVGQPEFRNAVARLEVPRGPDDATGATALLLALKGIERAFGRRERERWGPREVDLDLLLFGDARLAIERPEAGRSRDPAKSDRLLEVPHRSAPERLFVLAPLADVAPDLRPAGWSETVEQARRRRELAEGPGAVRPIAAWDGQRWQSLDPEVAPDGSPVPVYLRLAGESDAELIHRAGIALGLADDCPILELGAGAGRVTSALVALGHPVTAVDQSAAMLAALRTRVPAAETVVADVERLDLGRQFPLVLLGSHLVNVKEELRAALLAACRRHVAPDGAVLLETYDPDFDWPAHVGAHTRAGGVTVTITTASVEGEHLEASVTYEVDGRSWEQPFVAELLDEDALRATLADSGLRFDGWIDRRQGWFAARPEDDGRPGESATWL